MLVGDVKDPHQPIPAVFEASVFIKVSTFKAKALEKGLYQLKYENNCHWLNQFATCLTKEKFANVISRVVRVSLPFYCLQSKENIKVQDIRMHSILYAINTMSYTFHAAATFHAVNQTLISV